MSLFDKGHALVIGVGEYDLPRLRTPPTGANKTRITVSDAHDVAAALKNPEVCGYPEEQVMFLPDEQTTKQGIVSAMRQLARRTSKGDTVIIFFCGHGAKGEDGEYYFGTRDVQMTNGKFKTATGLGKTELLDLLRAIESQKLLLIVNACFSGNIRGTLAPEEEEIGTPPSADLRKQVLGTGEGRAMITASRSSQYSCFDPSQPNTYFGKALVDALRGVGLPGGEFIELSGLYFAVYKTVKAAAAKDNRDQEPVLTIVDQIGPFPIALSGGKATGTLSAAEIKDQIERETAIEPIPREQIQATGTGAQVNVITVGDISGSTGVAIGNRASATVSYGVGGQDLALIFQTIYGEIEKRPDDPSVNKDVLKVTVKSIEEETNKGEQANPNLIEKGLKTLALMAGDIFDVTVATLTNPALGIATVVKKIAAKASEEAGKL